MSKKRNEKRGLRRKCWNNNTDKAIDILRKDRVLDNSVIREIYNITDGLPASIKKTARSISIGRVFKRLLTGGSLKDVYIKHQLKLLRSLAKKFEVKADEEALQ